MKHCDIDLVKIVGFYDTLCVFIKDFGKENIGESKKEKGAQSSQKRGGIQT